MDRLSETEADREQSDKREQQIQHLLSLKRDITDLLEQLNPMLKELRSLKASMIEDIHLEGEKIKAGIKEQTEKAAAKVAAVIEARAEQACAAICKQQGRPSVSYMALSILTAILVFSLVMNGVFISCQYSILQHYPLKKVVWGLPMILAGVISAIIWAFRYCSKYRGR